MIEELEKQLKMTYRDQLLYLKNKYGIPAENYFLTVNCDRKSTRISKTVGDGLFIHHDYEYDPANPLTADLSKPEIAKQFTYKYQEAENLTYCDYLEHLILHCKINLLRKEQLNTIIYDGVLNHFIPDLNDYYRYRVKNMLPWQQAVFNKVKNLYLDYCEIVNWWLLQLGIESEDWKKLTHCK